MKALIVDDSRAIRGILGRLLTRNGFTVCEAVRKIDRFKALPCVMITTGTHLETVSAALQVGAEYIMKPFTSGLVVEKLRIRGVLQAVGA